MRHPLLEKTSLVAGLLLLAACGSPGRMLGVPNVNATYSVTNDSDHPVKAGMSLEEGEMDDDCSTGSGRSVTWNIPAHSTKSGSVHESCSYVPAGVGRYTAYLMDDDGHYHQGATGADANIQKNGASISVHCANDGCTSRD